VTTYRIDITRTARQTLHTLTRQTRRRLQHAIDDLAERPHPPGAVELKGAPNTLNLRTGSHQVLYTVLYTLRTEVVLILDIADSNAPWRQPPPTQPG
jgi:mRNA interferase RelE/StbE